MSDSRPLPVVVANGWLIVKGHAAVRLGAVLAVTCNQRSYGRPSPCVEIKHGGRQGGTITIEAQSYEEAKDWQIQFEAALAEPRRKP